MINAETRKKARQIYNNNYGTMSKNLSTSMPVEEICIMINDLESKGIEVKVVNLPDSYVTDGKRCIIKTLKIGRNYPLEIPNDTKVFYFYMWYRQDGYATDHSIIRFDTDVDFLSRPPKMNRVYLYEGVTFEMCECICGCVKPITEGHLCTACKGPNKNKRIDIKAILSDPIKKAKMIIDTVRTSRFFK